MESNRLLLKTNFTSPESKKSNIYFHIMRIILFIFIASLSLNAANAQMRKVAKSDNRGNYFFLNGVISDYDIASGKEHPAPFTQVVVYQNNELYVAFCGGEDGTYSFYLPLGYEYEVRFGGSAFVNKKFSIDATQIDEEAKPRSVQLSVSLFHPVVGADFSLLEEPYARMVYDPELDTVRTDEEYGRKRKTELERSLKKAKKLIQSSDALAEGMN